MKCVQEGDITLPVVLKRELKACLLYQLFRNCDWVLFTDRNNCELPLFEIGYN